MINKSVFVPVICMISFFVSCFGADDKSLKTPFTPVPLSVPSTSTAVPMQAGGTHVYLITTDSTHTQYKISLTNLSSDMDWTVCICSENIQYIEDLQSYRIDNNEGHKYDDANTDEIGTITLAVNTSYYLNVSEWGCTEGIYSLKIEIVP